eukprot:258421-Chlamydomonas_euryale.AAC.3
MPAPTSRCQHPRDHSKPCVYASAQRAVGGQAARKARSSSHGSHGHRVGGMVLEQGVGQVMVG